MRYSGWARIDYIGDPTLAGQYVPLARLLIGQVINRLQLNAADANYTRKLAYADTDVTVVPVGLGHGQDRKVYPDGTIIEAGYMHGRAWARINVTATTGSSSSTGYGFILSPFNGTEPVSAVPIYDSSLLLINGGAYGHDYPDAAHHWFDSPISGNYFDLGNEWVNNPLLQGNLHWRSVSDKTFHVSWLGNPSDPIAYFPIDFPDGIDNVDHPYTVRLCTTSGQVFNFDTNEPFNAWLAKMFGGLRALQNGSGIGQVVCYKGHVVKPIYDAFKFVSPTRSCILGCGGSTDKTTGKRTLYMVVRTYLDQIADATDKLREAVFSFDIDNPAAVPVELQRRDITVTGSYSTPLSVSPIPLHGYYWDETNLKFVCLAVQVTTTPTNDATHRPTLQSHSLFADTGKATWQIGVVGSLPTATFTFDNQVSINRSLTPPVWNFSADFTQVFVPDLDVYVSVDQVSNESFNYNVTGAVIAITDKNVVTTNASARCSDSTTIHNSGIITEVAAQHEYSNETSSTVWSQSVTIGSKTWDVAELTQTSNQTNTTDYDDTFSNVTVGLDDTASLTYNGKAFLWFSDTDQVYAYMEYQLAWTRTLTNNYGPIPITGVGPDPTETFNLTAYQGRYTVESPEGIHQTDWFDLTAGGQIGNAPGHNNNYAFMPKLPIRIGPGSGNDGSYTVISGDVLHPVYTKTYSQLPLFELANLVSFSRWNIPVWDPSSSYHTGVGGRTVDFSETDGSYGFSPNYPGGWAINGKRLCFSQIGPRVNDASGNAISQSPFQYLTKGNLDTLTGATGDDRGHYPLSYIEKREIKATGE